MNGHLTSSLSKGCHEMCGTYFNTRNYIPFSRYFFITPSGVIQPFELLEQFLELKKWYFGALLYQTLILEQLGSSTKLMLQLHLSEHKNAWQPFRQR